MPKKQIYLTGFMGTGKSMILNCLHEVCGFDKIEMDEQSAKNLSAALPAAVQQRCGQQISFAQIVQFQLHGRCTLSLCRVFMLCLHGSTGLFRSCCWGGDSALHRFVGVFPCPQRCGSRYVLR